MQQMSLFDGLAIEILGLMFEVIDGKGWLSTVQIAEHTGKRHDDVLADVRREFDEELEDYEEIWLRNISERNRWVRGKKEPYYLLDSETSLQLYARYDKHKRRHIIKALRLLAEQLEPKLSNEEKEHLLMRINQLERQRQLASMTPDEFRELEWLFGE